MYRFPVSKKSMLSEGFEIFCQWAADKKQLSLPKALAYDDFYSRGVERYWQMERLNLVQQPFRRSLEMWLVHDKALYLKNMVTKYHLRLFVLRKSPQKYFYSSG